MGRIRASFSHFLDVASEEVACNSGLPLSVDNIRRLAGRYRISDLRGITRTSGETVLRAEEFEEAILSLRVAIGELPAAYIPRRMNPKQRGLNPTNQLARDMNI